MPPLDPQTLPYARDTQDILGFARRFFTGDPVRDREILRILQGSMESFPGAGPGRQNTYKQGNTLPMLASTANQLVVEISDGSRVNNWLVSIEIEDPNGNLPPGYYGAGLVLRSIEKIDTDTINKQFRIGVGNAQSFYCCGKTLQVYADNPFAAELTLSYKIVEYAAGLTVWTTFVQNTLAPATETQIVPPVFARTLTVLTDGSAGTLVLRQYIAGVARHVETLNTPRSGEIQVIPGAVLTLTASAAMPATTLFNCLG